MMETTTAQAGRSVELDATETGLSVYAELTQADDCYQICCVDGEIVGALIEAGCHTRPIPLTPGKHRLTVKTANGTGQNVRWHASHDRPTADREVVPGFEILTNAKCPRACPGCNQAYWMRENSDYQYTKDNAQKLVEALETNDRECNLIFSGGEPKLWKQLDSVMDVFDACPKIRTTRITTSQYDRDWILHCVKRLDRVGISIRNDYPEYLPTPPEWMDGCERWDARKHKVGAMEAHAHVRCGCVTVGVTAAIVGDQVYPCTLAADRNARTGDGLRGIPVEAYVSGKESHRDKIGVMSACLTCVNNTRACGNLENT